MKHRDQPMETAYRQVEWHWMQWHGRDKVERSDIRDVPYKRYPRTFVPPPSVELTLATAADGSRVLLAERVAYAPENYERIRHGVNLLLELFGECHVMDQGLSAVPQPPVKRLNWTILPKGRMPWPQLAQDLEPIINKESKGRRPVIWHRLEMITAYDPEFVAVGTAGFRGYVIFAFPDRGLYILESAHYGNATYVFGGDWQTLSQMTKAEILNNALQQDRLIHLDGWAGALRGLFN